MYYFALMNIRINDEVHGKLISHLPKKTKIGPWVDEAIIEKICRENPEGIECIEPLKEQEKCKEKK
jgi:hypothetical protein